MDKIFEAIVETNRVQIYQTDVPMVFAVMINGNRRELSSALYQMRREREYQERVALVGHPFGMPS